MPYTLQARQTILYTYSCSIYRAARTPGIDVSDETFSLVASAIPFYPELTVNLSDPVEAGGRIKRPSMFVEDTLHLPLAADLRDGDYVVCTAGPTGSAAVVGTVWRVQGAPRTIVRGNKQEVPAMTQPGLPRGAA